MIICIIHVFLLFLAVHSVITPHQLNDFFSQYIDLDFQFESGYATQLRQQNNGIFYTLLYQKGKNSQTIDKTTPLFIWLEGGPGCSSQSALFDLIGPFEIKKTQTNSYTINQNEYSWNQMASILFIDQPFKTGFSYADEHLTGTEIASQYYLDFITQFLTLHPEFKVAPLYLVGFSYAGHFVPSFAEKMIEANLEMNYQGIVIGNGLTDCLNQIPFYMAYLYSNGLIDEIQRDNGKAIEAQIQQLIIQQNYKQATILWDSMLEEYSKNASIDSSNIDYRKTTFRNTDWFDFMNDNRDVFGIPKNIQSNICNDDVAYYFVSDITVSFINSINYLLDHGSVMLYNGQMDWSMNNGGALNWINQIGNTQISDWKTQKKQIFKVNAKTVGTYKKNDKFTYVSLYGAGHVAIKDKTEASYWMMSHYLNKDEYWI